MAIVIDLDHANGIPDQPHGSPHWLTQRIAFTPEQKARLRERAKAKRRDRVSDRRREKS